MCNTQKRSHSAIETNLFLVRKSTCSTRIFSHDLLGVLQYHLLFNSHRNNCCDPLWGFFPPLKISSRIVYRRLNIFDTLIPIPSVLLQCEIYYCYFDMWYLSVLSVRSMCSISYCVFCPARRTYNIICQTFARDPKVASPNVPVDVERSPPTSHVGLENINITICANDKKIPNVLEDLVDLPLRSVRKLCGGGSFIL